MEPSDRNPERIFNAIRTRWSVGLAGLSSDPIDLDLVTRMLEAANWAPSHCHTEPWRFTVFSVEARCVC